MFRQLLDRDTQSLTVFIDGEPVSAQQGESIAAVMLRQHEILTRRTPISGTKRAPFCMMGVCFDCLAEVDGVASVQTCLTTVKPGMFIVRQTQLRRI